MLCCRTFYSDAPNNACGLSQILGLRVFIVSMCVSICFYNLFPCVSISFLCLLHLVASALILYTLCSCSFPTSIGIVCFEAQRQFMASSKDSTATKGHRLGCCLGLSKQLADLQHETSAFRFDRRSLIGWRTALAGHVLALDDAMG